MGRITTTEMSLMQPRQYKPTYIFFVLTSSLAFAFGVSCKPKEKTNLIAQKQINPDSIGVIYEFDTTQYFRHKSGFYLSKNGDIFQLNTVAYDDSTGFWSRHFWLDSLMFYGEYPTQRPLRDIIDVETFTSDTSSRFEKDKYHVYYAWGTSDGVRRFVVDNADPKTFVGIGESYGKDKTNIYYGAQVVEDADVKTFRVMTDQDSAKDKRHIYRLGEKIN